MIKKLIPVFLLLFFYGHLQGQIITTVAGNGLIDNIGDGGPAIDAALGDMYYTYPAFDKAGNMYIAQNLNNTIRKIDLSGIITTIAGTNHVQGYSGDGGPAVNAILNRPTSIAVDKNNNVYFTDQQNEIIRKIDAAGIITTVSGLNPIRCVYDGVPLALTRFYRISGLTFDQYDNLYISDYGCHTVSKVTSAGIVTSIAGNGNIGYSGDGGPANQARLDYPNQVAIDAKGNVYIPDRHNQRIRKVTPTGIITTIAGKGTFGYSGDGGPALNAEIGYTGSIVIDKAGNIYYGDYQNVIRKIDPAGIITTYAGTGVQGYSGDEGPAILADIFLSEGRISIHQNDIYFVSYAQKKNGIRKISACLTASIVQQPSAVSICGPGVAVFSLAATNANGYQWQLNAGTGWTDLTETTTYSGTSSNTLNISAATTSMNHYQYRCYVTNYCGPVYSAPGLLSITSPANPSVTIAASSVNICEGVPVTFNADTENGGSNPAYQWKKNGVNVGTNQDVYTDNHLLNGDVITCILISDSDCILNKTTNSNSIAMTVAGNVSPLVSISASANNICAGTPVTFTTSVTNGGFSPTYTWFKNGDQLPEQASTYTTNSLNDGDVITCTITTKLTCVTATEAVSSPIKMSVIQLAAPSVTITSSANTVCRNTPVLFTASAVNEGNAPVYQWLKNGQPVGENKYTYTDDHLVNEDIIICALISNSPCSSDPKATSNSISILIHADPIVFLDKTTMLCEGSTRTLDAGNFASYLWNTGSTNRTLTINKPGIYSITVTDRNGCTGTDFTNITTLLPSPKNFLPADTSICSYGDLLLKPNAGFSNYLWSTGSNNSFLTITQPGQYWLQVKDNKGCTGTDSIQVFRKECLEGFFIPNVFTPNNDGLNDFMKPIILGKVIQYQFFIYNRWGQRIFQSTDPAKGWDGKYNQQAKEGNVFTWICSYQFEGQVLQVKRGSFILIR